MIAWIDLETTGLIPHVHSIIEIGVYLTDYQLRHKGVFSQRVAPLTPHMDTSALKINGYDEELWRDAIDLKSALMKLTGFIPTKATFGGHHIVGFDLPWLRRAYQAAAIAWPWSQYRALDDTIEASAYLQSSIWHRIKWHNTPMTLEEMVTQRRYAAFDTKLMGEVLYSRGFVEGTSLSSMAEIAKIPRFHPHRALSDAITTAGVAEYIAQAAHLTLG